MLLIVILSGLSTFAQTLNLKTINRTLKPTLSLKGLGDTTKIVKKLLTSSYTATNKLPSTVKQLDSVLKLTPDSDTARLDTIVNAIEAIRKQNSLAFLSRTKNKSFSIFRVGRYDVDTLNKYLYNQTDFDILNSVSFQNLGSSNNYVNAQFGNYLFGPVNMAVGGSFKTTADTTKNNAIKTSLQKIVTSGGAINLDFTMPLFLCRSKGDLVHFGVFGEVNNGFNPSITDTTTGKTSFTSNNILYTNQTGLLFHFDVTSNDGQDAKLTFEVPCYFAFGNNNTYNSIGLKNYQLVKLNALVTIKNLLNLNFSGPLWSSSSLIQNTPFTLTVGFLPSQLVKSLKNSN